jgi:hypothetical protein
MKKIIINKVVSVLALMAFALTPLTALATDMWAETPNLNEDTELPSVVIEQANFSNSRPLVNKWVETPDLNAETEIYDFVLDDRGRFASTFIPEMYTETPALDEVFAERHLLIDEYPLMAEGW